MANVQHGTHGSFQVAGRTPQSSCHKFFLGHAGHIGHNRAQQGTTGHLYGWQIGFNLGVEHCSMRWSPWCIGTWRASPCHDPSRSFRHALNSDGKYPSCLINRLYSLQPDWSLASKNRIVKPTIHGCHYWNTILESSGCTLSCWSAGHNGQGQCLDLRNTDCLSNSGLQRSPQSNYWIPMGSEPVLKNDAIFHSSWEETMYCFFDHLAAQCSHESNNSIVPLSWLSRDLTKNALLHVNQAWACE